MVETAPVVYGKYQLLDLLARGGMAEVFKAKSHGVEGFEKILVIKRILPELSQNPQFVEMFINEAKIAVTLSHANIVQVFDLGKTDDTYFIAMEYVAGYDLATVLRRGRRYGKPLPPELAVYIVSEVAKGLDYAHRRRDNRQRPLNIVHRDVSPQNVLLSYEGEVKLTDFGIAKARTSVEGETEIGVLKGKYAYMAPEQANGREVDGRTDLFALGTVLYESLSGVNPFLAPSTYDTLQRVRTGIAKPLREVHTEIPEELAQIVANAMDPDPDKRHPNAGRLYEDLIQFLYSSGRRVGAHDLSHYLDDVRAAGEAGGSGDDSSLRLAFEEDAASVAIPRAHEVTPVEIPSSRSTARKHQQSTGSGRRSITSASRPQAERRDVTALVLRADRYDPLPDSTLHNLLSRFGGSVVEDGPAPDQPKERLLVALFGIRDPDGRDTEAAARCALRIARAASAAAAANNAATETSVRLAIHAGRLLVDIGGEMVRDERYDRLAGDARALVTNAKRGQVLACPECARNVRGLFALAPEEGIGRGVMSIGSERNVAEAFGRFIGRRDELRRIGEVLATANRGKLRVIAITGEAGTGKSRLLLETIRRLRLGGHDVGMHLAVITRQMRDVPLASIQELLRVILGIDEFDPEPIIRDKVARLREVGVTGPEQAAVAVTLGLSTDQVVPPGGRPLRGALARIATKLAQDRLTVLAFDGVEAMDDESQALLDGLLRDARDARIGIALAYRPGFVHPWQELPGYAHIELGPLTDEDLARLTASRLGTEEVPFELLREVTAKSGGNPLYVEEYLKALEDAGAIEMRGDKVLYSPQVAEVEVPKTLRGIVSARVARLGPTERHILQVAAIAGARFTAELVAKVASEESAAVRQSLAVLEKRGVVMRTGPSEHAFAHELVGEVLRDGLTVEARRELHGAVANALEELYPQRVDEMAERLAWHCREAGDRGKAIDYLVRAAERLESEHALEGAITNLVKAIEMLQQTATPDRDRVLALYRRVGELSYRSRGLETGAEHMARALDLAEGLGRDDYVARFSMMRGRLLVNASRFDEGRRWLDRAGDIARRLGNRELLRDVALASAEACTKNAEYLTGINFLTEALALSRETADISAQIRCLIPLSLTYAATGDIKVALEKLADARRLAGSSPDRFTECELYKNESLIHFYARDHRATIEAAQKAIELAKEYGFPYECSVNAHNVGEAYMRLGDYKRAFAALRYSYEVAREHGIMKLQYINMRVLGFIDAAKFGSEEGRQRVLEALEYAQQNNYVWEVIQAKYQLAIIDRLRGDVEGARKLLREAIRLAAEVGEKGYEEDARKALEALEAGQPIPMPS